MAGIGFELRKLLQKDTLLGLLEAYTYAGIIGSGPWVLSILGVLFIGLMSAALEVPPHLVTEFQTSVTYIIASSLVLTGGVQLAFTRFISDRLFEEKDHLVLANVNGLLMIVVLAAGGLGSLCLFAFFPGLGVAYRLSMLAAFVLMCAVWVLTIMLSSMKRYLAILVLFAAGYTVTIVLALLLHRFGVDGLMAGFVSGHFLLFAGMWLLIAHHFWQERLIGFEFTRRQFVYPSLIAIGILYNAGVWADKFMFWLFPATSEAVIGPLRTSVIYDLPVFLAYLSVIPGMAAFMVRIETDFVEYYHRFYAGVRNGATLDFIEHMRDEMVESIKQGLVEIAKIQTIATLLTFVAGPALLSALGISEIYLPLLHIQVIGASLQVILLSVLNVFFYLDQRRIILFLCAEFLGLNVALTSFTLWYGAPLYGYGFTVAILVTLATALLLLDRKLHHLEYETFMLQ